MGYIVLLIAFGLLFLVAEIVLLPGLSLGGVMAAVCFGGSIYMAFADYGTTAGIIVIVIVLVLAVLAAIISLRAKTWQRLSLKQELDSTSGERPAEKLQKGDRGITLSRLSPMGKIAIDGDIYEAKSLDAYIDPKTEVEVTGFENTTVIVRKINN